MGSVNTHLVEEARSIFSRLGYTVSDDGIEFTAERGWKAVQVTPMPEPGDPPESGHLRCFVTYRSEARALRRQLVETDPEYDWAVISVDESDLDDGDYEVVRAPPAETEPAT